MIARHSRRKRLFGRILIKHQIGTSNRKVANTRAGAHIAQINQPSDMRRSCERATHQDIVIIEIIMNRHLRQRCEHW